ncbi:MAG: hypothetical protein AAF684_07180, partial [Pseudomonadota bacterium]
PADGAFYFYLAGFRLEFPISATLVGQLGTLYYFGFFLVIMPLLPRFEKTKATPESIATSVLGGGPAGAMAAAKPMDKSE